MAMPPHQDLAFRADVPEAQSGKRCETDTDTSIIIESRTVTQNRREDPKAPYHMAS